ncbi:hypothetical protein AYI68_g8305 [Smittium mucronatum]|uniref:Uncharacterized protein n=1 Tax=Smittium mucronatum TaxID=133383 RepID=A0A1R0GL94_9FUNG|nr:hypothetical protein AYI68_g8305 [Smittium mucronatum]
MKKRKNRIEKTIILTPISSSAGLTAAISRKTYDTPYSRVVSNHSTDEAIISLISKIGRDLVLSDMNGRAIMQKIARTTETTNVHRAKI